MKQSGPHQAISAALSSVSIGIALAWLYACGGSRMQITVLLFVMPPIPLAMASLAGLVGGVVVFPCLYYASRVWPLPLLCALWLMLTMPLIWFQTENAPKEVLLYTIAVSIGFPPLLLGVKSLLNRATR